MPQATINGLKINYAVHGNGPPMIMLSPGGFDSNIDGWSSRSVWKELRPLETLAKEFTMIAYDRREAGQSGGRVEPHTWYMWAAEAVALLDHLKIDRAWVIGGCMGVSVASAIGAHFPERCLGLLMHWPVGGFRWRAKGPPEFQQAHRVRAGQRTCRRRRASEKSRWLLGRSRVGTVGDGARAG
jgi:pimeloyl-ACP methyl ester carboxylesterase